MNISKKIVLSIGGISLVGIGILSFLMNNELNEVKIKTYEQEMERVKFQLEETIEAKKMIGFSNITTLSTMPVVIESLKNRTDETRIRANEIVGRTAKIWNERTDLKKVKMQIHTPDSRSLTRIYKPSKYGDDLSSFRFTINKANKEKKGVNEFESSRSGINLKSVVPVTDYDGTHLGSIEFMQEFNSAAIKYGKRGESFMFLVDPKALQGLNWQKNKRKVLGQILNQTVVNEEHIKDISKISFKDFKEKGYAVTEDFFYSYVDVEDLKGKHMGIMVAGEPMKKINAVISQAENLIIKPIVMSLVLLISIIVAILILINRSVLAPLKEVENNLGEFFAFLNKETTKLSPIEVKSQDEFGQMQTSINDNISRVYNNLKEEDLMLKEVISTLNKIEKGNFDKEIELKTSSEVLNNLKDSINNMKRNLDTNISNLINVMKEYTDYNYTNKIESKNLEGHLLLLSEGMNQIRGSIISMLKSSESNGDLLKSTSDSLMNTSNELVKNVSVQTEQLEVVEVTINEIGVKTTNTVDKSKSMYKGTERGVVTAEEGLEKIRNSVVVVKEIKEYQDKIEEASRAIEQVAFQTNILSLNAAVEAATAGEHGKGFAVVAQEVRNLAARSAEAAEEIKSLVNGSIGKTEEGVEFAEVSLEGFQKLVEEMNETKTIVADIVEELEEEEQEIGNIINSIYQLKAETDKTEEATKITKEEVANTAKMSKNILEDLEGKKF